jgi:hypothetical protein
MLQAQDPPDAGGRIDFIEMVRCTGYLVGARTAVKGDVYPVLGHGEIPVDQTGKPALMPIVAENGRFPMIDRKRAVAMIEARQAIKHPGPARLIDTPRTETASLKQPGHAERAVTQPQRQQRGAM